MQNILITGVYFHYYTNGYTDSVNFKEIEKYIKKIPGVIIFGNSDDLPPVDKQEFIQKIKELKINQLVIAGYSPGIIKTFFTSVMSDAKLDPRNVLLASFNDYGAISKSDTDLAKTILHFTIAGLSLDDIFTYSEKPVNEQTLIIGAGIAGIQASLEIANSKHKVYLLERTGTIGGHMATFDKTFPTLDCAACILTPKMVEVGQHPFIELLSYSEVIDVSGEAGNFNVKIRKKARRVDLADCIGCGICSEKCPSKTISEFDSGTTMRKSIYIPFPQAIPNKYLIDAENCIYVKNGKCGVCAKVCPADAVLLDQQDEEVIINVGNIVVATGFKTFDANRADNLGYGKFNNVLTSLEFERLVNASGPTEGKISFRSKNKKGNLVFVKESESPQSVAIIHCVGSRDNTYNRYCSKVCCMYSLKLAHLVKEKIPTAEVYEFYIDMRAYGKGYEEFYERIKEEGVHVIRGKTAKIEQSNGQLLLRSEDVENNRLVEQLVDMVVLSVGLEPGSDSSNLAQKLEINTDQDGWFIEENCNINPTNTKGSGITLAGACQGPKDIPDSVAHASAAALKVIQNIIQQKSKRTIGKIDLSEIEETIRQKSLINPE